MRRILKIDAPRCKSCNLCVDVCPRNYLMPGRERNPAGYLSVIPRPGTDCIACGTCVLVCPEPLALQLVPDADTDKMPSALPNTCRDIPPKNNVAETTPSALEDQDFQSMADALSAQAVDAIMPGLIQQIAEAVAENMTKEIIRKIQQGELPDMRQAAETSLQAFQGHRRAFLKGNDAVVCAALAAGCRAFFGYPITPASEIAQDAISFFPKAGAIAIQAESEISAINMLYGAAAAGIKAMTATSGPGFSLMQEGISYMAAARLPGVIINIMRAGPGLGNIAPEQSDYFMATRGGGHGQYHTPVLAPANVSEMFELTQKAFDIALRYRTPVIVLADAFMGQVMETIDLPEKLRPGLEATPQWAADPQLPPNTISSLELDPKKREKCNDSRFETYNKIIESLPMAHISHTDSPKALCIAYGICARIAEQARLDTQMFNLFRPVTLWPFPESLLKTAAQNFEHILVVECNRGQMLEDIQRILPDKTIHFLGHDGGLIPTAHEISSTIARLTE